MSKSKPIAFFVEFLLVLFFFIVVSCFVVQAFFHAYQTHQNDQLKHEALLIAQNVAETWDGQMDSYIQDGFTISFEKEDVYVHVIVSSDDQEWIRLTMYGGAK